MIYRSFGTTNIKLSQIGFGAMRFPLTEEYDPTKIDEVKATEMLHYAIDNGVNYIDNAYPYHRQTSEIFLGKALRDGYRERVYLATKMPVWLVKSKDDSIKYFEEQLLRLQTDVIDMYLLHSLSKNAWKTVQECNVLGCLDEMLNAGKIRYAGFSFHDELPLFKEIVDAYPWTFCLIQLNYVDIDYQAGLEGLEYAHKKGLAVMVMEPLRGGKLANNVPKRVLEIIGGSRWKQTPAQFALRWVLNRPEITCVLSGMSTLAQVKENIAFASGEHIDTLTADELQLYAQAREFYRSRTKVNCTQCGYCMPCPQKIPIPFILEIYNDARMYGAIDDSRWMYKVFVKPEHRADRCTACGECEEKCPQKIPVAKFMAEADSLLRQSGDDA
ncbi:MAG: aldo/keto reductase [candidate division WOR-3 bacterium]|nr:MAG: aldo/keto reductase [candidate division WOR-3 bacterium]